MNDSVDRKEMDMEIPWLLLFPDRTPAPPDTSVRGTHSFRCFKLYCLWERTLNKQFPTAFWQPIREVVVQSGLCLAQKLPLCRGYVCPVRSSSLLVCAVARVAVLSPCRVFDGCVLEVRQLLNAELCFLLPFLPELWPTCSD